jgi:hypothetical protein
MKREIYLRESIVERSPSLVVPLFRNCKILAKRIVDDKE